VYGINTAYMPQLQLLQLLHVGPSTRTSKSRLMRELDLKGANPLEHAVGTQRGALAVHHPLRPPPKNCGHDALVQAAQ
jgi:hypothetical protein